MDSEGAKKRVSNNKGVLIKQVGFKENVPAFFPRYKVNGLQ